VCAVQSNIALYPFGSAAPAALSGGTKVLILSDAGDVWPACQNYVILTSDRQQYLRHMNAPVMQYMSAMRADDAANPLRYIACPPVVRS
jgi:hypothetical protein